MKKSILIPFFLLTIFSCKPDLISPTGVSYKEEMRGFVIGISQYAKASNPNFAIIPQNGIELITENGEETGNPARAYLSAIDGHGQEDLYYGYDKDDKATPEKDNAYLRKYLDISKQEGNRILVTDYCSTQSNMEDSYTKNQHAGYISFAADERELNNIPTFPSSIQNENSANISSLSEAENFLYLINPGSFASKAAFISAVKATNYDVLIMDLFFSEESLFTETELSQLKSKANGATRMVVCYMSIGEAEDYRYYWKSDWNSNKPSWMDKENPNWAGNFKVKYWEKGWQDIMFGNDDSYLKKVLDAGFDGVYLDIIDAFEFYE